MFTRALDPDMALGPGDGGERRRVILLPGETWHYLKHFRLGRALLASSGKRPRMLLNTLRYKGKPLATDKFPPKMAAVLRMNN